MDIDAKQFLQTLFSSAVNQALPKNHIEPFFLKTYFIARQPLSGELSLSGQGKAASMAAVN
ncbi:hypothetical protein OH492_14470 [Vibrio chagasii]|nr:hypothetical protein [Vibrio chagasii]